MLVSTNTNLTENKLYRTLTDPSLPNLPESSIITEACREMAAYDRGLLHIRDRLAQDENIAKTPETLYGMGGELFLSDRLEWLGERGWDIDFMKSRITAGGVNARPLKMGRRVSVKYGGKETEIDCIVSVRGRETLGEAKSGGNSFYYDDATKRVSMVRQAFKRKPPFVLGVPRDHEMLSKPEYREIFEKKRKGNIVVFPATSEEIFTMATDLYNELGIPCK